MKWILAGTFALALVGAAALLHREKHVERSVGIAAPPEQVWGALTDFPAYGEWNPFIPELRGDARVGATLEVRITPARGSAMTFTPTVLAADAGRELRWRGRFLAPRILDGEHSFTLEPVPGGTRLTQTERFSGVLVPFAGGAIDVGDDFAALNAALRDRVEAGATLGR